MIRAKLPPERTSYTVRVGIHDENGNGTVDMYVTVGENEDGSPAELFVKLGSKADAIQALLDCWAIGFSISLQCGADFEELARKFAHRKFEPYGPTDHPEVEYARSAVDWIVRWMSLRYGSVKLFSELQEAHEALR